MCEGAVDAQDAAPKGQDDGTKVGLAVGGPLVIAPEWLPAVCRLLARQGLGLDALAYAATAAAESAGVIEALQRTCAAGGASSTCWSEEVEGWAARRLLAAFRPDEGCSGTQHEAPHVAVRLQGAPPAVLRQLLVPGAAVLGLGSSDLRAGPGGALVVDLKAAALLREPNTKATDGFHAAAAMSVVVAEVAYEKAVQMEAPEASGEPEKRSLRQLLDAAPAMHGEDACASPSALCVEQLQVPPVARSRADSGSSDSDAACSSARTEQHDLVESVSAWAEALCERSAAPVALQAPPATQAAVARFLQDLGLPLLALSARSHDARAILSLRLKQPQAASTECLQARQEIEGALFSLRSDGGGMQEGALVAGLRVERAISSGVLCCPGGGRRDAGAGHAAHHSLARPVLLHRARLPRSRVAPELPAVGSLLAALVVKVAQQTTLAGGSDELYLSLQDSQDDSGVLADLLAQQVDLRVRRTEVLGGSPERIRSCKTAAEGRYPDVWVDFAQDGLSATLAGPEAAVDDCAAYLNSMRLARRTVSKRLGGRIVGKGGAGRRILEQESGVLSLWLRNGDAGACEIEAFGDAEALSRLAALLAERHVSLRIAAEEVQAHRVIGKGGMTVRRIEKESEAALFVNAHAPCEVEILGTKEAVEHAERLVRQLLEPGARLEIPQRNVGHVIGKGGAGVRDIENASGANLRVLGHADPCVVEIFGHPGAVAAARDLLAALLDKHACGSFDLSQTHLPHMLGRGGAALREMQQSSGAQIHVNNKGSNEALAEVYGTRSAVDAALALLRERAAHVRRSLLVPPVAAGFLCSKASLQQLEDETQTFALLERGNGECWLTLIGAEAAVEQGAALAAERMAIDTVELPQASIAHVIGKGGATIRGIQATAGANVQVEDGTAKIAGPAPARASAKSAIEAILAKLSEAGEAAQRPKEVPGQEQTVAAEDMVAAGCQADEPWPPSSSEKVLPSTLSIMPTPTRAFQKRKAPPPPPPGPPEDGPQPSRQKMDSDRPCQQDPAAPLGSEIAAASSSILPRVDHSEPVQPSADASPQHSGESDAYMEPALLPEAAPELQATVAATAEADKAATKEDQAPACVAASASASAAVEQENQCQSDAALEGAVAAAGDVPNDSVSSKESAEPSGGESAARATINEDAATVEDRENEEGDDGRAVVAEQTEEEAELRIELAEDSGASRPPPPCDVGSVPAAAPSHSQPWWLQQGFSAPFRAARSRSPRRISAASTAATEQDLHPELFILDGMNILKSRNRHGAGGEEVGLEWSQLESACRFFTTRKLRVSVFLPPVRMEQEPELERLRRAFGEIFVHCHGGGASDDVFMINTVKVYEETERAKRRDGSCAGGPGPLCCIVTNDAFRDWQRDGSVDAAWVERHCLRYIFGPCGFVPSRLY
eukprot:TRINITY_DN14473_c0_g2_i1.p1 TRINITY_DN14473_c0_g2~~TRINITY_DN14473_c0_g2_i1.p1  ORF type:complete len:1410 (+),score=379.59 TRINITY_DN14473_c0_g2_i1:121-4350(+)